MSKRQKKNKLTVYSTNPDFKVHEESYEKATLSSKQQFLEVWIDKHRAGKIAVLIMGFIGTDKDLKLLGKKLKIKCGVGGSAKNSVIIIQGNVREKVMDFLDSEGYNYKRVGG